MDWIASLFVYVVGSGTYYKFSKFVIHSFQYETIESYNNTFFVLMLIYVVIVIPVLFVFSQKIRNNRN